jgi:hypothetical protein
MPLAFDKREGTSKGKGPSFEWYSLSPSRVLKDRRTFNRSLQTEICVGFKRTVTRADQADGAKVAFGAERGICQSNKEELGSVAVTSNGTRTSHSINTRDQVHGECNYCNFETYIYGFTETT